jgi:hypothetical protein
VTRPIIRAPQSAEITVERLERALEIAADLVVYHGDAVVPFFERIEEELHALRKRSSAADRARQMAARTMPRSAANAHAKGF